MNVLGVIDVLSDKPDFAMVRITGGQTVLQHVESVNEIAVFPSCMTVLKVTSTINAYEVTVFVNDPSKVNESTFRVKSGVIRSFWGLRMNIEKDVSFAVETSLTSTSTLSLWPASNTLYTATGEFSFDVQSLFVDNCAVDETSFGTANVRVLSVTSTTLTATLVDSTMPGSISFLGYLPNTCSAINYPVEKTAMVVKVPVPTYTLTHAISSPGCSAIHVEFTTPVTSSSTNYLSVVSANNLPYELEASVTELPFGQFVKLDATLCVSGDSDTFTVGIHPDVTALSGEAITSNNDSVYISKVSMILTLDEDRLPEATYNEFYVMHQKSFQLSFNVLGSNPIGSCDFSKAFTSDYLVAMTPTIINGQVLLDVDFNSIDYHTIAFDASKVHCDGAFSVEFIPTQIKFAYDPAFVPGDIVVTRVNSYYSPEFDFVPLRKVYTWNRIFFTDSGWVNEVYGFIDHGSDGTISWTPKTDVEAGTVQQWSYVAMTQSLDRSVPKEVDTEYSFNYEMHGFLLDFQDNLFIYVTGDGGANTVFDDYSHITFIFGIYWSSSEWAEQTYNYMDITSEYSSLPLQLSGYNVALGTQAVPVPRGVNYMSIKQSNFNTFSNTYYHMIEKIVNKDNWVTSQKDRFNTAPLVSYVERPMDFTMVADMVSSRASYCFQFATPFTINVNRQKVSLTVEGEALSYYVSVRGGSYCLVFNRPTTQVVVELGLEKGAFTYTTSSTSSPYTFESVAYQASNVVYNTPSLSINRTNSPFQFIEITSTIPCSSWGEAVFTNAHSRLVSRTEEKSVYAVVFTGDFSVYAPANMCMTEGNLASAAVSSYVTYYTPIEATSALLEEVHFEYMKTNTGDNSVLLKFPTGWYYDASVVPTLNGTAALNVVVNYYTHRAVITFDSAITGGDLIIPSGLFYVGPMRSVGVHSLHFDFNNTPVDVINHMELPWTEPVTSEAILPVTFSLEFAPGVGSSSPRELLRFEQSCRTLGYVMGPAVTTSVPIAIMHGECIYGVVEEKIVDSYGNVNAGYEATKVFDFLPPVGTVFLAEDNEYAPEVNTRFNWNIAPVVGIAFNEVVVGLEEEPTFLEVTNCAMVFNSISNDNDRTIIRYLLVNCTDGEVELSLIPDIVLRDTSDNTCFSQDAITLPFTSFFIDTVAPKVTLSAESDIIYGNSFDIHYEVSEVNTQFTCSSIGIAVSQVHVDVVEVIPGVCHYTFTPKPLNGTYVVFSVPGGRFNDIASNGNVASNTLTPLVLNEGAVITVNAPEYTSMVQTEFTVSIAYTWLCPNYEQIFPSTFEYDRDIARIEKTGDSVIVNGVINQSFTITFFNFETFPEDRYKNMPIYIPAMVCTTEKGLYNQPVSFMMSFDNTPTEPAFEMHTETVKDGVFSVKVHFEDMQSFGQKNPEEYMIIAFENQEPLACTVSRAVENAVFSYTAVCPLSSEGNLNVTILRGATVENTGVVSSSFSRILFVDANPPMITLSTVDNAVTFGPSVTSLPVHLTVSEIMSAVNENCFVFEGADYLTVSVTLNDSPITSNQFISVNMINTHVSEGVVSGSFSMYIAEGCVVDSYNNRNIESNHLSFNYDFSAPSVVLTCPTEDVVLNTITFTGEMSKPCQPLTPENIQISNSCSVRDITMNSSTSFEVTVSCYDTGAFEYSIVNYKDLVGNVGIQSSVCSTSFTIYGPTIQYTVKDLVKGEYVNTKRFSIELTAAPNCYSMNLTFASYVTENVKNILTTQKSACTWEFSGENIEEGLVVIRILEGAAVDVYGGPSLSRFIEFRSYQSVPTIISVTPSLVAANSANQISICYDRVISRGEGNLLTEGACSSATITSMSDYCMNVNVAVTVGTRCYLNMESSLVKTLWELGSVSRYVFLEINNQPPTIEMSIKVNNDETTAEFSTAEAASKTFYINANGKLEVTVPSNMEMNLQKLVYSAPACMESIEVEEKTKLEISLAYKEVEECSVAFTFGNGFFVDAFGRSSLPVQVTVDFSKIAAVPTITLVEGASTTPIAQIVSFNKMATITEANIVSAVPFTINKESDKRYAILLTPEAEGEYTVEFKDVKDVYGNAVTVQSLSYAYYTSQPTTTVEDSISVSTLQGAAVELNYVFNHRMANVPTVLSELYECDANLAVYFTLTTATVEDKTVALTLTPKEVVVDYKEISCTLSSQGFVDVAGNTVMSTGFSLVIDNQAPRIESVTHNSGSQFSRLPVAITITFTKLVTLHENYASMVHGKIGDVDLTFIARDVASAVAVNQVTLVSETVAYEPVAEDRLTVTVDASIGVDANNLATTSFTADLFVTSGSIALDSIQPVEDDFYAFKIVMSRAVSTVLLTKIEATNVELKSMSIDGNMIEVHFTCPEQGAYTISFTPGCIVAADDSMNEVVITHSGVFDTVAPSVVCTVPATVGATLVSIPCVFSKPVQTASSFFTVERGDIVLFSKETLSEDGMTLALTFTPIESVVADYTDAVVIAMKSCKDNYHNECLPVRYQTMIDFTRPVPAIEVSRRYVKANETIDVVLSFSKAITSAISQYELTFEYSEDIAYVAIESFDVVETGLTYKWSVTFSTNDLSNELIPFNIMFAENTVVDANGNGNKEATETVFIHEVAPQLSVNLFAADDEKQQLTLNVAVLNGPITTFTSSMLSLSSNLELIDVTVVETIETSSSYHLTFQLSCTATCSFSVRFLSEMIFNLAGNQLEHDVTFDNMYVVYPTVTLSSSVQYFSASLLPFTVTITEPVDIDCSAVVVDSEDFVMVPSVCYNAMECECAMEVKQPSVIATLNLKVPAESYKTAHNAGNLESEVMTVYYSGVRAKPMFMTEWTKEDGVTKNIPFTVTPNVVGVILTPDMIKCFNCEIGNWFQLESSVAMYTFTVSFLNDNDNYARVYIEANAFVDPYGHSNEASESVLRKQSVIPVAKRLSYHSGRVSEVAIEFSHPIQACEGSIHFTPADHEDFSFSVTSQDATVTFKDRVMSVKATLLPNTLYTVSWEDAAICDATKQLAATECAMCSFTTTDSLPAPPMNVVVDSITDKSVMITYDSVFTGAEPLRAIMVYTVPSITPKPYVYQTSAISGSFTMTGFASNTEYKVYLASFTNSGVSILSQPVTISTLPATPEPVSHVRICSVENPTGTKNVISYTEATVCWDASPSKNVRYEVTITELINGNPGRTFTAYSGEATAAGFTVSNDVERYEVAVATISTVGVVEGTDRVSVSAIFETTVDLENVVRYPQGAGIKIAAERLSSNSVFISFTHPYENYFPIEKYLVQYGNTFDDTFEPSGTHLESYPFRMDKCLGNYVTVTIRAGVNGDFWGVPSNRVVVYCKTPRLTISTEPGYNFVSFTVSSDVSTKAICTLKAVYNPEVTESLEVSVNGNKPAHSYLFKSLTPDTDYKIECEGYDVDYSPVSGVAEFYTTANFELPAMIVDEMKEEHVDATAVTIPIQSVNMPGTVYCVAKPIETPIELSRVQFIKQGASTYMYPGTNDRFVLVSGLTPATAYHAKCYFDPDFSPSMVIRQRRLVDEEILFTTPLVSASEWKHIYPAGSVVVPLYQPLLLTAKLPISLHHGVITVRCMNDDSLTQRVDSSSGLIRVKGTVAKVTLPQALTPGKEYRIEMTLGLFLDEAGYPMAAVTAQDKIVFIATSDERMISEPKVLQTVPAAGSVSDLVSMKLFFTFDREIQLGNGGYTVKVNEDEPVVPDVSTLEVTNSILTINNPLFLKPDAHVHIGLQKNAICSAFLVCNSEPITLDFTIGKHSFEPSLISMFPVDGQTSVPAGEDLKLSFNKEIALRDEFVMTFTDEKGNSIVLKYVDEKSKLNGYLSVVDNEVIVKGSLLPAGHKYFVLMSTEAIMDKEGRHARSVPASFSFTSSQYACGGKYIAEKMGENCSCFLTSEKCECWCGESETGDDVVIRKML